MYSILIVDDEHFMRNGIAKVLPWETLGIDHVDTAESGTRALMKMKDHMPDIVITDIEMDQMDGLTLIRKMNQANPMIRIIVLTGHDDFDYVRECCRMEVQDYLLKPVEAEKLSEAVRAQVEALDRYAEEQARKRTMDRVNGLAEQMKVERAFRTLLKNGSGLAEIRMILEDYGYQKGDRFQAALIRPECAVKNEWSGYYELLNLSIKSVCIEHIEYHHDGVAFQDEGGIFVLLLFKGDSHPDSQELLEQLGMILQNEYDVVQKVSLGREVGGISEIAESYQDAVGICHEESSMNAVQGPDDDVIGNVKRYINSHLDQPLSVSRLAGQFYLSVAYFSKLFKKTTGVGCNYYIVCQRMERAKKLLEAGSVKVGEVSEKVGYKDVNYFSLTFKNYTGCTPAEYREKHAFD